MIDWFNLAANSLWILGCALALAALSYASWQGSLTRQKVGKLLQQPGYQVVLNFSGSLFCLGLAGTSGRWWVSALWLILAAYFLFQLMLSFKRSRSG
jgi:hypothetical protein